MSVEIIEGYVYVSGNGQVVVDTHPSDEAHLRAGPTHSEQPLRRCRTYLRDLVPAEWIGRRVTVTVERASNSAGGAVTITIIPG